MARWGEDVALLFETNDVLPQGVSRNVVVAH
jgi:hypothetical protein